MKNIMNIKSAWPQNANKFRASSNGNVFTRTEKINIVNNRELQRKRISAIQAERAKIQMEKQERAKRFRVLRAMADNPQEKIKRNKGGQAYIQRRIAGKFQPKEVIA